MCMSIAVIGLPAFEDQSSSTSSPRNLWDMRCNFIRIPAHTCRLCMWTVPKDIKIIVHGQRQRSAQPMVCPYPMAPFSRAALCWLEFQSRGLREKCCSGVCLALSSKWREALRGGSTSVRGQVFCTGQDISFDGLDKELRRRTTASAKDET